MVVDKLKLLFRAMRPAFLLVSVCSIYLGICLAIYTQGRIDALHAALVVIGALAAQISVNLLNEYRDHQNELDVKTHRTPFSVGSGVLSEHPAMLDLVLNTAIVHLLVCFAIGLYFVYAMGFILLPFGLVGFLIILTYTQWISRHPYLDLIAPGFGLGVMMVTGTNLVLTGLFPLVALLAASVPFFLTNNLYLLNRFPNVQTERAEDRNYFPIAFGLHASLQVYAGFVLVTALVLGAGIGFELFPQSTAIALIPLLAALAALYGGKRKVMTPEKLTPFLLLNLLVSLLTPALLGTAMLFA